MKLIDKVTEKRLEAFPRFSQSGMGLDAKALIRYSMPSQHAVWLVYEGERISDDEWLFNVYMTLGGSEWGFSTIRLSDIRNLVDVYGNGVERDVKFKPASIRRCLRKEAG